MGVIGIIVSVSWGLTSAGIVFQAVLGLLNAAIALVGLILGREERRIIWGALAIYVLGAIAYSVGYLVISYVLTHVLSFGYSQTESTIYWAFFVLGALYVLLQFPAKLLFAWRASTVPGALEASRLEHLVSEINQHHH
jgi:hypothetical protein